VDRHTNRETHVLNCLAVPLCKGTVSQASTYRDGRYRRLCHILKTPYFQPSTELLQQWNLIWRALGTRWRHCPSRGSRFSHYMYHRLISTIVASRATKGSPIPRQIRSCPSNHHNWSHLTACFVCEERRLHTSSLLLM
jgi:hypothetical protein